MKIILFSHPDFLRHKSMPRYANMLIEGMKYRGHFVESWQPKGYFVNFASNEVLKKWLGYIDQYIIFPLVVRRRLLRTDPDTLFVFADNALGPWVPLVKRRPHIVHCHDLLAQFSALNLIPENRTSMSGRLYQLFIRRGLVKSKNFICISAKTQQDLYKLLPFDPNICEVVYNGLNQTFTNFDSSNARTIMNKLLKRNFEHGYILHVGGNQWYKNRMGVIEIYKHWRSSTKYNLPLLLVGEKASAELSNQALLSNFKEDIIFLENADDRLLRLAYYGAQVLVYPSLAEGFGWPIAEAMAAGCPVITTDEAPMNEVAGEAGLLIPKMPQEKRLRENWLVQAASVLETLVNYNDEEYAEVVDKGLINAERFNPNTALDHIESIYLRVIGNHVKND